MTKTITMVDPQLKPNLDMERTYPINALLYCDWIEHIRIGIDRNTIRHITTSFLTRLTPLNALRDKFQDWVRARVRVRVGVRVRVRG